MATCAIQIARIEADIEQLAQTLDGCRKAMALAKVAIAAGGIWILAYLLGAISFDPTTMIAAIAAIIGGVVVLGSNSSTSKQTTTATKAAEAQRAEARTQEAAPDDMINFRAVGSSRVAAFKLLIHKRSQPCARRKIPHRVTGTAIIFRSKPHPFFQSKSRLTRSIVGCITALRGLAAAPAASPPGWWLSGV